MRRRPAALLALLAAAAVENALLSAGEKPSLKIRGVNLGGWLVLEKWIKPSLFSEWDAFDKKGAQGPVDLLRDAGKNGMQETPRAALGHLGHGIHHQ